MKYVAMFTACVSLQLPALAAAQDLAAALRPHAAQWQQLVAAEDARAHSPEQLRVILTAARAPAIELRALAVRALGRLERADLADSIAISLRDAAARVRVEAAHALGQSVHRGAGAPARPALLAALTVERDANVLAALAETLGRLRHGTVAEASQTIDQLVPLLEREPAVSLGALRGLFFLARQQNMRAAFVEPAHAALVRAATHRPDAIDVQSTRMRTVAAAALITARGADASVLARIMGDADAFVRREAVVGLGTLADSAAAAPLVTRALNDASPVVRLDALRVYGARLATAQGCNPIVGAVRDASAHVSLLAIDLLGTRCSAVPAVAALLDSLAATLPGAEQGAWHKPAHALVSLAAVAPARAQSRIPAFVAHPNFFVRTYAAAAAGALREQSVLLRLSRDVHPNVRTAAVEGLSRTAGHAADSVYIAQLAQDDSQLLQAAAAALDSTPQPDAVTALLAAFERVSHARSETSRDARVALLQRLGQLGSASLGPRLQPFLRDFDPVVAARAADALQAWTGTRPEVAPAAPAAQRTPTFDEAAVLAGSRAIIELAAGGEIEIELLPFDAPTNAARFARLARTGYFDGLTFHRNAPNFVVQGGSPNANEYAGDAPFTRDELAVENWRGTVGLSTRGRDTGDAQIYINLIDNVRLDHDYTVFGRVLRGMDAVDRMLEGAVMRRVLIRPGTGAVRSSSGA